MSPEWEAETREQRHRNREVVVVMISWNWKEWLVKDQPLMADGFPVFAVLEPVPVGLEKVAAVLISTH